MQKLIRMKGSLHFIGLTGQAKHTVFVDSAEEAAKFSPAEYFDTPAELLDRSYNRPRRSTLNSQPVVQGEAAEAVAKVER
jgi:U3 small nucleolar RNA-associated protein 11